MWEEDRTDERQGKDKDDERVTEIDKLGIEALGIRRAHTRRPGESSV